MKCPEPMTIAIVGCKIGSDGPLVVQSHRNLIKTSIIVWIVPFEILHTQTTFMGTPLFVVTNGLPLFVARGILARYGVYRWRSYNAKTSYKIISVAYSMILYPKFPQKTTWENTMAEHVRPSYFPMWYIGGTISKRHHLIITDLFNGK